jgi:dipeptidyl aminopeptidase/acylaminoacyl peptidase
MKIRSLLVGLVGCSGVCLSIMAFSKTEPLSIKKYAIEQFLNTKTYLGGAFSFNEEKILFSSDESGVFNVYSIPVCGGNQTQLTNSTNHSFTLLSAFSTDDRFLYASDGLGNELNHIFLRDLDGSVRDLTPWTNAKSEFYGWSKDQKSFFFLSNNRDPKFMDLYEMDIETFQPKILYQNQNRLSFRAISADKRYLALTKTVSANSSEFYLYDLSTNTLQNIAPHQDDIQYQPVDFSADCRYLYYLTDQDSEFTYLKRLHIDSGVTEIVENHPWDIFFCSFSHTGKYRVTGINEDGKTVIQIHDQQTNARVPLPKLPAGEITQVSISKTEKSMLFYVNGDRSPSDLYYYNFETSHFHKLTNSLSSEINPADLVDAEIIRYPSYDGTLIPALYYKPKDMQKDKKMPALLWVHGGPGGQSRIGYSYLIQYLVNHGYPVLSVNNRGSSGYGKSFFKSADHKHGEADLDDCIWAKYFLIGTGNIDKDKIGIIGGSYGGYMTLAALAFRPNEMAVGVDIFGISNWVRTLKSIPSWWETQREAFYKKIGNPETETVYLESISPLFHADSIRNPLLVIQGANDPRVLKIESDQIIEAVNKTGVPNQYLIFDDEGHGLVKKQNQMKAAKVILEFLDEHLR